jgi:hypothetical protein
MKKLFVLLFFLCATFSFAQTTPDSITRRPALRGMFRWILASDLYEEGNILNNLKTGEWKKFYQGKQTGSINYKNGLALSENFIYRDTVKVRYKLSDQLDSMMIYDYDLVGKLVKTTSYAIDAKTIFLNYSLMTEDTIFKKTPVTEITYDYKLWNHRNDVVVVTETTGGIPNKKYFSLINYKWTLLWELNDKGDFLTGKKKEFLKEEEKSKKFLEGKGKKG